MDLRVCCCGLLKDLSGLLWLVDFFFFFLGGHFPECNRKKKKKKKKKKTFSLKLFVSENILRWKIFYNKTNRA
jgi:hypothetical protein